MGGYIEDAQISSLGLEIYQEINGLDKYPSVSFVIPYEDENWPVHLWGYKLGEGVEQHIAKFLVTSKPNDPSLSINIELKPPKTFMSQK